MIYKQIVIEHLQIYLILFPSKQNKKLFQNILFAKEYS